MHLSFGKAFFWRTAFLISLAYFVTGGIFSLWFPLRPLDLHVFYAAGVASLAGENPYLPAVVLETMKRLDTPIYQEGARVFTFAYPPSWIPISALLAVLPWSGAVIAWKVLNSALLALAVVLSLRLFSERAGSLDRSAIYGVCCLALTLSPTISTLGIGQSSLVVLCALLGTLWLKERCHPVLAGVCLAIGFSKPQLALPFCMFLLWRREHLVLTSALVALSLLAWMGMLLTGASISHILLALQEYSSVNPVDNPRVVGLANLLSVFMTAASLSLRQLSAGVGFIALISLFTITQLRKGWLDQRAILALLFLVGPLFFGARSYDLVFVIPLIAYFFSSIGQSPRLARMGIVISTALIIPLGALEAAYAQFTLGISPRAFGVLVEPFRSWVLVLLLLTWVMINMQRGPLR